MLHFAAVYSRSQKESVGIGMRSDFSPPWLLFIGFMVLGLASNAIGAASHSSATAHVASIVALTFHAMAIVAGAFGIVQNRTARRRAR